LTRLGILVLPGFTEFDRVGFSNNAGLGNPAYNVGFDSRFHDLVLAEPRPGSNLDLAIKTPGQETGPTSSGLEVRKVHFFGFTWFDRQGQAG